MDDQIRRQKLIDKLNSYHYTAIGMRCGKKMTAEIIKGYHDHVIEVIESQPPADQWIPCSERLPEKDDSYEVTILLENGARMTRNAWFEKNYKMWMVDKPVIAWRERLDEPYKGVE